MAEDKFEQAKGNVKETVGNVTDNENLEKEGKEDKAKVLAETVPDPGIALELEITIDGTGGIIPGNCFQVDYIPETFKKFVIFQAITVGHSISSDNWTTTISGPMRVAMNKLKED